MFAYFRAPVGWLELARRTILDTRRDGVLGLAAQLAFYFLLAVFPTLLFLVSLLTYLPVEDSLGPTLERLEALLPTDVLNLIRDHIEQVLSGGSSGLWTFAIVGAIWSSSAAMEAIISALNHAYDVEEFRPWWQRRLIAIGLTLALAVFTVSAFALVVGGADLAVWIAPRIGFSGSFETVWTVAQWGLALAMIVFAVDLVYHFAPNAETKWVWITPGSLLGTGLWLLASLGFKVYVQQFSNFTVMYGAIGGIIVLMLWFYLSGFALLVGAELNAEIDKSSPGRDMGPQGPGRRRKIGPATEAAAGAR